MNVRVFPYINGRLFDMTIPQWVEVDGEQYCVKRVGDLDHLISSWFWLVLTQTQAEEPELNVSEEDLRLDREFYGIITSIPYMTNESWLPFLGSATVFAVGCPSTSFWQRQISQVIYNLTSLYGVDGVYIGKEMAFGLQYVIWNMTSKTTTDQIGAATAEPCFQSIHNHTQGKINWICASESLYWLWEYCQVVETIGAKGSSDCSSWPIRSPQMEPELLLQQR